MITEVLIVKEFSVPPFSVLLLPAIDLLLSYRVERQHCIMHL